MTTEQLQKTFAAEMVKFQDMQKKVQKVNVQRQQLDAQLTENKLVKEEMDLLEDDANVFKLIGPALVKQDLTEARENVNRRIKYLEDQVKSHQSEQKDIEEKMDGMRPLLAKMQAQLQEAKAKEAAKAGGSK